MTMQSWRQKRRDYEYDDASWKRTKRASSSQRRRATLIDNDVLEEIMLKLPVKSLVRFQVLSKHWRHKVKSKYFKERYMLYQKTQEPKFLCLYGETNLTKLTLNTMSLEWSSTTCLVEQGPAYHIQPPQNEECVRVSGSCDGLVCLFDEENITNPIIVTNPAIGRSQTLPLSRFQRLYLNKIRKPASKVFPFPGFGKDNVTGTYKLVWLHNKGNQNASSCEVFDFEVKEWRYVRDTPHRLFSDEGPIFADGWLYWLTDQQTILAYNLHTKMFQVITNRILSQASCLEAIGMCSLNDRVWVTDMTADNNGIQHFWRIKNALESDWEFEKMFSLDSSLISPWFPPYCRSMSLITLIATSKDTKKVLVSRFCSSKFIKLLPHSTSLGFLTMFNGPSDQSMFIPYFQSLDFPL